MRYCTAIDNIGLQIDTHSMEEQDDILQEILEYVKRTKSLYVGYEKDYHMAMEKKIYYNGKKVATIVTNRTERGRYNIREVYYISISFAGLTRYKKIDKVSKDFLLNIFAYLNSYKITYKINELDVCIDARCSYNQIIATCTKKTPNTRYFSLKEKQKYSTTSYVEKFPSKREMHNALIRTHKYNKRIKDQLPFDLTRYEIKLPPRYWSRRSFNINEIRKTLDRYYILYFENMDKKDIIESVYNSRESQMRHRDFKQLGFEEFRLHFDIEFIEEFINTLLNVDDFSLDMGFTDIETTSRFYTY